MKILNIINLLNLNNLFFFLEIDLESVLYKIAIWAIGLGATAVGIVIKYYWRKLRKDINTLKKVHESTIALLREEILEVYFKIKKQGYRTTYDTERISHLYALYKELGGNTYVDKCFQDSLEEAFKDYNIKEKKNERKKK